MIDPPSAHRASHRALAASMIAVMVAFGTGCSTVGKGNGPYSPPSSKPGSIAAASPAAASTPAPAPVVPRLTAAERIFAGTAASHSLYAVEASKLAGTRASSNQVKSFAQALVSQHTQARHELVGFMRAKGMTGPPAALAADKLTRLHRLETLTGAEFDRGYIRSVGVDDHSADIALFERVGREAHDRELKAWIDKTLPVLRTELVAAQGIAGSLGH